MVEFGSQEPEISFKASPVMRNILDIVIQVAPADAEIRCCFASGQVSFVSWLGGSFLVQVVCYHFRFFCSHCFTFTPPYSGALA